MGAFYTNVVLKGPGQDAVVQLLSGRSAFVSDQERGFVVVLDEACESQDTAALYGLVTSLSRELACPALGVLNHDDDALAYVLAENGSVTDEYMSPNDMMADFLAVEGGDAPPSGDASRLASAFGADAVDVIASVLARTDYVFESQRHADLAEALGLPSFSVGAGFHYASLGDLPSGGAFVRIDQ